MGEVTQQYVLTVSCDDFDHLIEALACKNDQVLINKLVEQVFRPRLDSLWLEHKRLLLLCDCLEREVQ